MSDKPELLFTSLTATWFVFLFITESYIPLRQVTRPRFNRIAINLFFSSVSAVVGALAVRPAGLGATLFAADHNVGLLNLLKLSPPFHLAIGFLLMDLSFYYWHRLNHVIPLLWRFHNVHHSDPDLDVSTSFRFHFAEILYSSLFRIAQVAIIGISIRGYIVYELIFSLSTIFHHSNIKLPIGIERSLNKIFVTPRMHGVHHSFYRDETNSNYSVIFSFWDRLHQSLMLNVPQSEIQIGIPAYHEAKDNSLLHMLKMPFLPQRKYWEAEGTCFETRMSTDDAGVRNCGMLE